MPSQKPVSREYRMYLAIWRKAWQEPHKLIGFECSTYNMAIAMRQGMYRAIRPFRYGHLIDEELRRAADKYVVYIVKPNPPEKDYPHRIELRERAALVELEGLSDILGIDEEDLLIGDERQAAASLRKLIDGAVPPKASSAPKVSKTPFYTREEE